MASLWCSTICSPCAAVIVPLYSLLPHAFAGGGTGHRCPGRQRMLWCLTGPGLPSVESCSHESKGPARTSSWCTVSLSAEHLELPLQVCKLCSYRAKERL